MKGEIDKDKFKKAMNKYKKMAPMCPWRIKEMIEEMKEKDTN